MAIRVEYTVQKLPDSYVTTKIIYSYVLDPDWKKEEHGANATHPRIRTETVVEERGGWLFTFMRGHQIRVTSEEQMKALGIKPHPRLVDDSTGLECDERGVPLDIAHMVKTGESMVLTDGGQPDTVEGLLAMSQRANTGDPISDAIADTE